MVEKVEKNPGGLIAIPAELNEKLLEHARQKGITINQEATEMLELAISLLETLMAAKNVTMDAETEL